MTSTTNEWETLEHHEGLVSIGNHQLFLSVQGKPRRAGEPVVVFESGAGASGGWWAAVETCLKNSGTSARLCHYDRAGLGRSEASAQPRSAENMANELSRLLDVAKIAPPYLLVAHSYGGIIAREFLALRGGEDVYGMILVETNQEKTHAAFQFPIRAAQAIMANVNAMEATGLAREHRFTPEQLQAIFLHEGNAKTKTTPMDEMQLAIPSSETLASKRQLETIALGDRPVTVIRGDGDRDFMRSYDAYLKNPAGTEADREEVLAYQTRWRESDERLQREQCRLSNNSRFVQADNSGHNVQVTQPEIVADEIIALLKAFDAGTLDEEHSK